MTAPGRRFSLLCLFGFVSLCLRLTAAEQPEAELDISGYGFFGNRELMRTLQILRDDDEPAAFFDANFIEDAALILMSRVQRDGYLVPIITAHLVLQNGERRTFVWDHSIEDPLPRPMRIVRASFEIRKGPLFHYQRLEFRGLSAISREAARALFIEVGALLRLKQNRIYTPERLRRSVDALRETLQRQGYEKVEVAAEEVARNEQTGAVAVRVDVKEGPRSIVRSVRVEVYSESVENPSVSMISTNAPFSQLWQQDFAQQLRRSQYRRGYPDAKVDLTVLKRDPQNGVVRVDLLGKVQRGPQVRVGEVRFEGLERTKRSVLEPRVRLEQGDLLDRIIADRGRYRLARLGIFDSVELRYETAGDNVRDVVYKLDEGRQIDLSLLFGYGSYEMLRVGLDIEQYNVFGRAHHSRLRLIQSFKASSADYIYTMPELVGEDVDVFLNASGLRREEISFTREEYGGGAGARRYFRAIDSDVSVRYNYQVLNADDTEDFDPREGIARAAVGALIADIRHDRRDNPLYPRQGYKLFANLEVASEFLGGDVNYQRLEIAGSYHHPLDRGTWISLGLSHGVVFTVSGSETDLPFNRRFFPGGESSIRGFQEGEAAPRDSQGNIVGAETYLGGNLEIEQALTRTWSVVAFFDAIGFARELSDYPFDETLFSVGAGIRWRTLIGPVRLEYGHNLNPRHRDPGGTLHFSIGFPF